MSTVSMRGGQPWYYYLWLWPFYEFLVITFGVVAGFVYVWAKRRGVSFYEKLSLLGIFASVITVFAASSSLVKEQKTLMLLLGISIALVHWFK